MRLEDDPFLVSHGPFAGDEFVNFRGGTRWATSYKLQVGPTTPLKKVKRTQLPIYFGPFIGVIPQIYRGYELSYSFIRPFIRMISLLL